MYAPSRPSDGTTASTGESEVNSSIAVNSRERRDVSTVDSRRAPSVIVVSPSFVYFFFCDSTGSALNPDFSVTTLAIALGVVLDGSKVTSAVPLA